MASAPELLTGPCGIAAHLQQGLVADDAPLRTQAALDPAPAIEEHFSSLAPES